MIRELKHTDIAEINSLPPKDWKFNYEDFLAEFLKEDYYYPFVMEKDNKIIGTGNVFLKEKTGWLANIIVDENYRGKGLGLKMTRFLVDFLTEKGCETQLLIATELGEPVYKKLGFKSISVYQRYDSVVEYSYSSSDSVRKLKSSDLTDIYELDMYANGENRRHLIDKFYRNGVGYFKGEKLQGVYLPDFGRGLVLARNENAGIELLKIKHSEKGRVSLLPLENKKGIKYFEKSGLKKGYKCLRMVLNKENGGNPESIYSYGGGYFG